MENTTYLALTWAISRGRDTYGYNIARLDDRATGKRYRCSGGGYDMVGTVFGQWLQDFHQKRLQLLRDNGPQGKPELKPYAQTGWTQREDLYGLFFKPDGSAHVDGACGIESMRHIAEACGLTVKSDYCTRKRRNVGFFIG